MRGSEYEKQVIREIESSGCFAAEELAGGNVLITQYYDPRVFEVDKKDRVIWELTPKDLPQNSGIQHFSEAKRLPSGNTLVVNFREAVVPSVSAASNSVSRIAPPQSKLARIFINLMHEYHMIGGSTRGNYRSTEGYGVNRTTGIKCCIITFYRCSSVSYYCFPSKAG